MPQTNIDIVWIIASYCDPNPLEYTSLAMVNKDFYKVFTSDKLWSRFDAYHVGSHIFENFIELSHDYKRLLVLRWHPLGDLVPPGGACAVKNTDWAEYVGNKYVKLGYYQRKDIVSGTRGRNNQSKGLISPDEELIPLLIQEGMFYTFSVRLKSNEQVALLACHHSGDNVQHVAHEIMKPSFKREIINQTLDGGSFPPYSFGTTLFADVETLEYAAHVNPAILSHWLQTTTEKEYEDFEPVFLRQLLEPKDVLVAVRGVPRILNKTGDEVWSNHEFITSVFQPGKCRLKHLPKKFLNQCDDEKIVRMALQNFPESIFLVHKRFRCRKEFVMLALRGFTQPPFGIYYKKYYPKQLRQMPWNDRDIFTLTVEKKFVTVKTFKDYPDAKVRALCCGDFKWVKKNTSVAPHVWTLASLNVKKSRRVLIAALSEILRLQRAPPGLTKKVAFFDIPMIPQQHYENSEIMELAAEVGALCMIPTEKLTEEMVRVHLHARKTLKGLRMASHDFYEIKREAVLNDFTQLWYCWGVLEKLVDDPEMRSFIARHSDEIIWLIDKKVEYFRKKKPQKPGYTRDYYYLKSKIRGLCEGCLEDCTYCSQLFANEAGCSRSRLRSIKTCPRVFLESGFSPHSRYLAEAAELNGYIFEYLPVELQRELGVQNSLGSMKIHPYERLEFEDRN